MNCIAVDDEPIALDILKDWISNVPFLSLKETFRSTLEALEYLQNNAVDLVFLDINTPALSGIQLMKLLDNNQLVIFTTAYPQYAIESYELNAVDYLLKPIEFDRFLKASLRAKEIFELKKSKQVSGEETIALAKTLRKEKHLFVKSGNKIFNIETEKIKYIESSGNYVTYVTEEKKYMCLQGMEETLNSLPENEFIRVHKSYIVSLKHIDKIENNHIKIGDVSISIGRTFHDIFYKKLKF